MDKDFKMKSDEFWRGIIENEDGTLNKKQIYNELSDYYFLMKQVPEIYCAITNNQLSNTMYTAKTVISAYEDCLNETINESIEDEKEVWKDEHEEEVDKLKEENELLHKHVEDLNNIINSLLGD